MRMRSAPKPSLSCSTEGKENRFEKLCDASAHVNIFMNAHALRMRALSLNSCALLKDHDVWP